jgi:nitrite reductase/ring-hydroxylating ferredoxin subunit
MIKTQFTFETQEDHMAEFVKVARADDLPPGEMAIVDLGGREIVIANLGAEFVAFQNECPHRGGPLAEGLLVDGVVECPFHAGQFDVRTGEAVAPPPAEPIMTYAVRVEGGDILVAAG